MGKHYFYFDGNSFKEYGGKNINIEDIMKSYMNITKRFIDGEWEVVSSGIFDDDYKERVYLDVMISTFVTYLEQFQMN